VVGNTPFEQGILPLVIRSPLFKGAEIKSGRDGEI
jgi:hypothetical protein